MPRVKRGKIHMKRRRNILKQVKGYRWGRKSKVKLAKTAILKAGTRAFADRRIKKRTARALWQVRINAAARIAGTKYSALINDLKKSNSEIDRKILSELGAKYLEVFKAVVEKVTTKK